MKAFQNFFTSIVRYRRSLAMAAVTGLIANQMHYFQKLFSPIIHMEDSKSHFYQGPEIYSENDIETTTSKVYFSTEVAEFSDLKIFGGIEN